MYFTQIINNNYNYLKIRAKSTRTTANMWWQSKFFVASSMEVSNYMPSTALKTYTIQTNTSTSDFPIIQILHWIYPQFQIVLIIREFGIAKLIYMLKKFGLQIINENKILNMNCKK